MAIFLRDNGVLSMGNKTPVTILHETLNRKGVTPNYELVYNGVGTLEPIFKYQVSALGFIAIGDGKTKKEAKHDAAAALLQKMQINSTKSEGVPDQLAENVDIASPYSGSLKENYIGMLEDICTLNKIPFAVFKSISELGPPHARIFTMECKLSSCTEVAVARTKKQAKHMAAHQMIDRVMEILGDKFIPVVEKIVDYDNPEEPSNLKDIENGTFNHDMSIPLAKLHDVFHLKREDLRVPQEFFDLSKEPSSSFDQLENPKEYLENLVRKLEGVCKSSVISNTTPKATSPTEINFSKEFRTKCDKDLKKIVNYCNKPSSKSSMDDFELLMEKLGLKNYIDDEFGQAVLEMDGHNDDDDDPIEAIEEHVCDGKQIMMFLTIICPQREYVFSAIAADFETAERRAAVEALKFLRTMALPTGAAESQVAADPLEVF